MLEATKEKTKDMLKISVRDGLPWALIVIAAIMALQWWIGYPIKTYVTNLMNLVWLIVTIFVFVKVLRYLSRQLDVVDFSTEVYAVIKQSPVALAIYFGLMFVGVAHMIAKAVGG